MDKFLALTEEKRLTILNAALQCFGKFGYEKASINDIAVAAHISKELSPMSTSAPSATLTTARRL